MIPGPPIPPAPTVDPRDDPHPWLLTGRPRAGVPREPLLEVTARVAVPTILTFSLYLLLVGHYAPGGGFTGGLVAGLAFVLRFVAGGSTGVWSRPVRPPLVIGTGLAVAVLTALVPLALGAPALSTTKLSVHVPLLGAIETQTSLFLDVGVYLLIVGVVLDLLRSLGAGIERDLRDVEEPA